MSRTEVRNTRTFLSPRERLIIAVTFAITVLAGILTGLHANAVLIFIIAGVALALLAALIGQATESCSACS